MSDEAKLHQSNYLHKSMYLTKTPPFTGEIISRIVCVFVRSIKSYEYNLLKRANQFTKDVLGLYARRYKHGSQLLETLTSKYLYIHKRAAFKMNLSG